MQFIFRLRTIPNNLNCKFMRFESVNVYYGRYYNVKYIKMVFSECRQLLEQ